jgi:hypothetical protein
MLNHLLRFTLLSLLSFVLASSQAQGLDTIDHKGLDPLLKDYTVFRKDTLGKKMTIAAKAPEFRGGIAGWTNYLEKNLNTELGSRYIKVKKPDTSGRQTIVVNFTVSPIGVVSAVTAEPNKENHPKLVAEAVRVVSESPRWVPAVFQMFEDSPGKTAIQKITEQAKPGFTKVEYRHEQHITFLVSVIYDKK